MHYLYVCHFSNGHIKVGRSISPKSRIASHADRVACVGIELIEYHLAECVGHAAPAEDALIERCAAVATKRNRSEWFEGLDYLGVCKWVDECAQIVTDYQQPIQQPKPPDKNIHIRRAFSVMGGPSEASRKLGINNPAVLYQWRIHGRVPIKYAIEIEVLTNGAVRCEDLRPDVNWGVLRNQHAEAA